MRSLTGSARSVSVPETVPLDTSMDEYILPGGQHSSYICKKKIMLCIKVHWILFFVALVNTQLQNV